MEKSSAGKWRSAAAALALLVINAYITWRLFRIEYLDEMWNIEGVYIGLARYIREHFFDLNWFPLWYGGIPYQYSYPPLLHFIVAGVAAIAHISDARAYHIVAGTFYCLGPVALFWTARQFGASRHAAFLAGLFYSVISPSCILVRELRVESGGWFAPRLLRCITYYGDGPHVASLVLLTFALGVLHVAMEKRRPIYYFGAALALASVVLTNWIGGFALALGVASYLMAGFPARWLRVAGVGCVAYMIAMPWTTPATIRAIEVNARILVGFVPDRLEIFVIAALVLAIGAIAWAMMRLRVPAPLRFAVLFFLSTAAIALSHYWGNFDLLPQPNRYDIDMSLAVLLTAAFLLDRILKRIRPTLAVCIAVLVCLPLAYDIQRVARGLERPIDVRRTAEYKVSRWLGENMPGARVFASGSMAFWMTAFSDTAQLRGGFDNGVRNPVVWGVTYQIQVGESLPVTLAWLKALGCDAIVGNDPDSGEFFHDFHHPEKLHTLPELWRDGPEVIYAVPRRDRSLAHAMRAADLPAMPEHYDATPSELYLAALDDPAQPPAKFAWDGMSAATVEANLHPEHVLSIQISWDQGWHASVDGQPRPLYADKLGQIVVEPNCNGPCTVDLSYDGGLEMRVARIVSPAAFLGCLLWIFLARRRATK
jgi:hypothetical protein